MAQGEREGIAGNAARCVADERVAVAYEPMREAVGA
jgi:hypothetical protein